MLVIIDNTFHFHGKTAGAEPSTDRRRRLKRLRILAADAACRPLFETSPPRRRLVLPRGAHVAASRVSEVQMPDRAFAPFVDDRLLDLYARARNPSDQFELRDPWLGRWSTSLVGTRCGPGRRSNGARRSACARSTRRR